MNRGEETVEVRVLAVAEGYAMVRRTGAAPFIVREADLFKVPYCPSENGNEGGSR